MKEHLLIFWQRKLEDAYRENYDLKAENARLKAEVEEMKSEVTYQKQKAQEMVEFICECVAKGDFKIYKNAGVRFGLKAKKGDQQ